MKQFILFICAAVIAVSMQAQNQPEESTHFRTYYKYRIYLKDKKGTEFSVKHPEQFLSRKAIERRQRQHLKIDETDLPVSRKYIDQICALGVKVCSTSKWNNTVLVKTEDTTVVEAIARLPFVAKTRKVATYTRAPRKNDRDRFSLISEDDSAPADASSRSDQLASLFKTLHPDATQSAVDSIGIAVSFLQEIMGLEGDEDNDDDDDAADNNSIYGAGYTQINQLHGIALHDRGFRGQGMTIAIIDGGFYNADIIPMLKDTKILGTKDFVDPDGNVFEEESHGMMVLSCIATNTPNTFIGTAPEASFWLLRSEDGNSEQPVEEDNWAAAVEYADSVGADVVNTSLGYSKYDDPADLVSYSDLDGHTMLCSNTASMMASKGMVLCNSAGNEGDNTWKLISAPADADDVLTVGAVDSDGTNTLFSSLGNTADGRIKPDVMAMGGNSTVLSIRGRVTTANGTSFASPIMCGMVTCFWQAHPELTAKQVVEAVRMLGHTADHPNNVYGYGIPDFSK